ncbi:MAG: type II secretion system F family protein [Candidatus Aenigmarchaeota archaeon]|nr:type II secretion system F family protein [Candidatus Aenigmarchaeota archaeon]
MIKFENKVLVGSLAISIFLISLGLIDPGVLFLGIILSTFIIFTPQMFFRYEKYRVVKEMETRFPAFLRDVIEHVRAGSPVYRAIIASSKIDYGGLSKEVKRISNQLSWGIPLDKVLEQFARRTGSKKLHMAIYTIRESFLSGGDISLTLEALADSLTAMEESEKERKSLLNQYVIVMYVLSLVFIGVITALNSFMVPIFKMGVVGAELAPLRDPCETCQPGVSCGICSMYESIASSFGIKPGISAYYVALFFLMTMTQAFFAGLIIGQISRGSVSAGLIHSIILTLLVFGAFGVLSYLRLLG